MKVNAINVNLSFDLRGDETQIDLQVRNARIVLEQLEAAGIEVNSIVASRSGVNSERANRDLGPNEAALLERSGKSRMRCPSEEPDREAYAARLLKERYGVNVESVVSEVNTLVGNGCDDDDNDGLI